MVAAGDRHCRIQWAQQEYKAEIWHKDQQVCSIEEPDDLYVHVEDYTMGDPNTNGKGHVLCAHPVTGRPAVRMRESNIWRLKRKHEKIGVKQTLLHGRLQAFFLFSVVLARMMPGKIMFSPIRRCRSFSKT